MPIGFVGEEEDALIRNDCGVSITEFIVVLQGLEFADCVVAKQDSNNILVIFR